MLIESTRSAQRRIGGSLLLVAFLVGGCGASGAPSSAAGPGATRTAVASPSAGTASPSASPLTSIEPPANASLTGVIAFTRGDAEEAGTATFVVNPDGSGEKQLFQDGRSEFPRWSPDGTEIQINCCDDGMAAHLIDPATGDLLVLPQPDPTIEVLCGSPWSPDGERIGCEGFGVDDERLNGIYSIRASDGGGLRRITVPSGGEDIPADFSPDGVQLLFFRERDDGTTGLYVTDMNGSRPKRISPPDLPVDTVAAWSPDGRSIVFETRASDAFHGELWVINADGSSPHELMMTPECGGPRRDSTSFGCFDPGWSPDGSHIVFARSSADGERNIYIVNADGTDLVQVTHGGRDHQPDWGMPPAAP